MDSHKLLDDAKAALKRRADANGDGKVDMKDVETVLALTKGRAIEQTQKHPIGAIATTAAIVIAATVIVMKVFGF
jgi:hypothetical protein